MDELIMLNVIQSFIQTINIKNVVQSLRELLLDPTHYKKIYFVSSIIQSLHLVHFAEEPFERILSCLYTHNFNEEYNNELNLLIKMAHSYIPVKKRKNYINDQ